MKINAKRITAVLMAAAMSVCATTAAFAASTTDTPVVDENHATADFQQKITYSKSESEIVPAYTVPIPLTAELQKESSTLSYTLGLVTLESKYFLLIAIVLLTRLPYVFTRSLFVLDIKASSEKLPSLPKGTSLKVKYLTASTPYVLIYSLGSYSYQMILIFYHHQ